MSIFDPNATPRRHGGRRPTAAIVPAAAVLVLLAGCASGGTRPDGRASAASYQGRMPLRIVDAGTGNSIPVEQSLLIEEGALRTASSLYDLIARSRPHFLHERGMHRGERDPRPATIGVYMDGAYLGGPEALRTIPLSQVIAVHRVGPGPALTHLNRAHPSGALYVVMRR